MMLTYIVPSEMDGTLLHDVLRRGVGLSAQLCKTVKRTPGALLVDGRPMFANQRVHAGMTVTVEIAEKVPQTPPKDAGLAIVYEDDALLCIDKPSGMVCHPTRGLAPGEQTLLDRAAAYLGYAPHPVHRLDRGTSGLWLTAKNAYVQSRLQRLEKTYLAVCAGAPCPAQGTIKLPILTDPDSARRRIDPAGQHAVTHYETIRTREGCSLLRVQIETGRTHQIRVHLSAVGCPILGDALYGNAQSAALTQALGAQRLLLHAAGLRFVHPVTGRMMTLRSRCQTFPTVMME